MKRGAIIGLLFISIISIFLLSGIAGCGSTSSSESTSISDDDSSSELNDDTGSASASDDASSSDDATNTQSAQTAEQTQTEQSSQETGAQLGQGAISIESLSATITKIHEWPETRRGEDWAEVTLDISGSATASSLRHPEYYGTINIVYFTYPQDYKLVTDSEFGKQYIDVSDDGYSRGFGQNGIQSPWPGNEYPTYSGGPLTVHWTGQVNAPFQKGEQIMVIAQLNWPSYFEDFFQATEIITPFP